MPTTPEPEFGSPDFRRVRELQRTFRTDYKFLGDGIEGALAVFGPTWATDCEDMLSRIFPSAEALAGAARGYAHFVLDLVRRQKRFEKDRTYPTKSYAEAQAEVYLDDSFMRDEYLPGLLLSHYLWLHHYRQLRFFESAYSDRMAVAGAREFLEVGVGTGLYSRRLLQRVGSVQGTGVDISPAAMKFTEAHLQAFSVHDRYQLKLQDIMDEPLAPTHWLVCVEVLEHLEDPVAFLSALRRHLAPGGRAFVTAAINAPHVDHIYLYENSAQVTAQVREAGFFVEQGFEATAYEPADHSLPVPAVVALVLQ